MVSFESDYIAGAHPAVLRRLAETNLECLPGYGADPYCERAAQKIRALCGSPAAGCAGRDRPAEWKEKFYEKKDCRSFVMSGNGCRGIFRYGGCVAGLERQQRDMAGPQ